MKRIFSLAIERARAERGTNDKKFFFSAIALRRDGALVSATNNKKAENKKPPAHAEARLMRKVDAGSIVVVARVTNDGQLAMAKPCPHCEAALRNKRVKRVFYSVSPEDGFALMDLN